MRVIRVKNVLEKIYSQSQWHASTSDHFKEQVLHQWLLFKSNRRSPAVDSKLNSFTLCLPVYLKLRRLRAQDGLLLTVVTVNVKAHCCPILRRMAKWQLILRLSVHTHCWSIGPAHGQWRHGRMYVGATVLSIPSELRYASLNSLSSALEIEP